MCVQGISIKDIKLAVNFITLLKSYKLLNHPVWLLFK